MKGRRRSLWSRISALFITVALCLAPSPGVSSELERYTLRPVETTQSGMEENITDALLADSTPEMAAEAAAGGLEESRRRKVDSPLPRFGSDPLTFEPLTAKLWEQRGVQERIKELLETIKIPARNPGENWNPNEVLLPKFRDERLSFVARTGPRADQIVGFVTAYRSERTPGAIWVPWLGVDDSVVDPRIDFGLMKAVFGAAARIPGITSVDGWTSTSSEEFYRYLGAYSLFPVRAGVIRYRKDIQAPAGGSQATMGEEEIIQHNRWQLLNSPRPGEEGFDQELQLFLEGGRRVVRYLLPVYVNPTGMITEFPFDPAAPRLNEAKKEGKAFLFFILVTMGPQGSRRFASPETEVWPPVPAPDAAKRILAESVRRANAGGLEEVDAEVKQALQDFARERDRVRRLELMADRLPQWTQEQREQFMQNLLWIDQTQQWELIQDAFMPDSPPAQAVRDGMMTAIRDDQTRDVLLVLSVLLSTAPFREVGGIVRSIKSIVKADPRWSSIAAGVIGIVADGLYEANLNRFREQVTVGGGEDVEFDPAPWEKMEKIHEVRADGYLRMREPAFQAMARLDLMFSALNGFVASEALYRLGLATGEKSSEEMERLRERSESFALEMYDGLRNAHGALLKYPEPIHQLRSLQGLAWIEEAYGHYLNLSPSGKDALRHFRSALNHRIAIQDLRKQQQVVLGLPETAGGLEEAIAVTEPLAEEPIPAVGAREQIRVPEVPSAVKAGKFLVLAGEGVRLLGVLARIKTDDGRAIPMVALAADADQKQALEAWARDLWLEVSVADLSQAPYFGDLDKAVRMIRRYYASEKGLSRPLIIRRADQLLEVAQFLKVPDPAGFAERMQEVLQGSGLEQYV